MNKKRNVFILAGFVMMLSFFVFNQGFAKEITHEGIGSDSDIEEHTVRLGFFMGGRVNMIYRAYINHFFDKEGIKVKLYVKDIEGKKLEELSKKS